MDRHSDQYTAEDMEEVGRRLIDALHANRDCLKGWYPADCPTEIVVDLINARDEALAAAKLIVGEGRVPDRECFWLVERNVSPPQYVSLNSAGWHPDVWVARRFNTEREAHDYWRLMGETDRQQFKVVEHMFINKVTPLPNSQN